MIVIIVAVLAIGGVLAYQYYWQAPEEEILEETPTDKTADWKVYRDEKVGIEIKYPSSWESPFGSWATAWTVGKILDNNYCVIDVSGIGSHEAEIPDLLGKGYVQTSIKIGGIAGIRLTRYPSGAGLTEAVYFSYKGKSFRIGRNRSVGDKIENECINVFNQILSTFKFTK